MRKVDDVVVGRRIGAMVETELAVIAFVDHVMMVGRTQLRHIPLIHIDPIEQGIERGTQVEAAPAAVTDLIDPQGLLLQLLGVNRRNQADALHDSSLGKQSAASSRRRTFAASPKTDR